MPSIWQLQMKTPTDKDWMPVSTFATVTEAACRRIDELEASRRRACFWNSISKTNESGTDEEAFRVFHYTGERALYGIKHSRPN
jgi:hypothetical protein